MRARSALLLAFVLLLPIAAANRDTWTAAGAGESNDCDAVYVVEMERSQPSTFLWDIRLTIVPDVRGADGTLTLECVQRSLEWHDVLANDAGPWRVDRRAGGECPQRMMIDIGTVPLEAGGPIPISYFAWSPCHELFDHGEGTIVAATADLVTCVSVLCLLTS